MATKTKKATTKKRMTQKQRIFNHLSRGRTLNSISAWTQHGVYRVSDVISKLRKEGFTIDTEEAVVKNRYNENITVARYRMVA